MKKRKMMKEEEKLCLKKRKIRVGKEKKNNIEVEKYNKDGINLERLDGLQVNCNLQIEMHETSITLHADLLLLML